MSASTPAVTTPAAAPAADPKATSTAPAAATPDAGGDVPAAPAEPADSGSGDVPALGAEPEVTGDAAGDVPQLGDDVEPDEPEADPDADAGDDDPEAADDAAADDDAAPIDYEFEAPEDGPAYREPVLDAYKDVLQKHRVAPEVAKDILDTMLPVIQKDTDAQVQAHIESTKTEWREQLAQRHGNKLGDVRRLANRALQLATPELRAFIRDSALAEHPDFNDLLAAFGQRFTNDRPPKGRGAPRGRELSAVEEAADEYSREQRG